MLRFLTAGESHGKALVTVLEGVPAGLAIDFDAVTAELRRRQGGYGRGRRMAIESDRAEPLSGVRHGLTTGAPIALMIPNKDWENWQRTMHVEPQAPAGATGQERPAVTRPRPGHADLAGVVKYGLDDIRNVLERASARETASRVAVGAIARQVLQQVGAEIVSHVTAIGPLAARSARGHLRRGQGDPVGRAAALRRSRHRARDDRRDRSRPRRRRHDGRQLRGDRPGRSARPRQLRAMGPQARRTTRAGADVDSRDQGGRHRPRTGRRRPARVAPSRRDSSARRPARRWSASSAPPTTRAGSKAASPTARTCESPAT